VVTTFFTLVTPYYVPTDPKPKSVWPDDADAHHTLGEKLTFAENSYARCGVPARYQISTSPVS